MAELQILNNNPLRRSTGDCVYRALATFLGVSWREALNGLVAWAADRGMVKFTYISTLKAYMESLGYTEHKMPKKGVTVAEFCDNYAKKGKVYILNCPKPRHWTVVKWADWQPNAWVVDKGDCRDWKIDRYWERNLK